MRIITKKIRRTMKMENEKLFIKEVMQDLNYIMFNNRFFSFDDMKEINILMNNLLKVSYD